MFEIDKSRVIEPKKVYSKPQKPKTGSVSSESYTYLTLERGIDENIISKMNIECYDDSYIIPFYLSGVLVDTKRFYLKRGKDGKKFMKFEQSGTKKVLLGIDLVDTRHSVLTVFEGETDCFTALTMGLKNCVSIPNGVRAMSWVDTCYDFHMKFKEIFICFDADSSGAKGADELSMRLGKERCRIVNLYNPKDLNDVNELYLNGKEDFIKKRFLEAKHPQEKDIVHAVDLIEQKKQDLRSQASSICSSGFRSLDYFILGRDMIRPKEITCLSGNSGSGKSQLTNNLSINIAQQGKGVFIASYEQEVQDQFDLLGNIICGEELKINNEKKFKSREKELLRIDSLIEKTYNWLSDNNIFVYGKGFTKEGRDINNLLNTMEYCYKRYGTQFFVIDPITLIIEMDSSKSAQATTDLMQTLQEFVKKFKVHMFVVMHPRKLNDEFKRVGTSDLYGSSMLLNYIDNFMSLFKMKFPESEKIKKVKALDNWIEIICLKNRMRGENTDNKIDLLFDANTKRYNEIKIVRKDSNIDYVETSTPTFIDNFVDGEVINKFSTKEQIEKDYMDVLSSYNSKMD